MRVLVTGHNGYLGSVMVPFLLRRGHEVAGLDSYLFGDCSHGPTVPDVPAVRVDLRDVEEEHVRGFDAVVHLAALSNDPLGNLEPTLTHAINHHASVRLAELAKAAGVRRFLYSSSCSIYGAADTTALLDETAPFAPVTPYAESKVRVESELRALADDTFSPVFMRNATVYGWSPRLRCDLVLNDLVARAHLTGEVRVLSDGSPWRPVVHVEDVARAFAAALEAPVGVVHGEAFNVGAAADNRRVRDLAETVAEVVPGAVVAITGRPGADTRSYRVDFRKITRRLPVFRPRWNVERGARELYAAYLRHGLTADRHVEVFTRLGWLTKLQREGRVDAALRWQTPALAGE